MKNSLKIFAVFSLATWIGITAGQAERPSDSSMIEAVQEGNLKELQDLIRGGGNVNASISHYLESEDTPILEIAATKPSLEIVEELLKYSIYPSSKNAVLAKMVEQHKPKMQDIAKVLIQKGADVNMQRTDETSLLMVAAIEYLKQKNKENKEVISDIITHLIIGGANIHLKNKKGNTLEDYSKKSLALRKIIENAQKQKIAGKKL